MNSHSYPLFATFDRDLSGAKRPNSNNGRFALWAIVPVGSTVNLVGY